MTEGAKWGIGAEVVFRNPGGWHREIYDTRTGRIAKIYKNGHIVLEGDAQQYRPLHNTLSAVPTGGGRNRPVVSLITAEVREKMEAEAADRKRRGEVSTALSELDEFVRFNGFLAVPDDLVRAINEALEDAK